MDAQVYLYNTNDTASSRTEAQAEEMPEVKASSRGKMVGKKTIGKRYDRNGKMQDSDKQCCG